MKSKQEVIQEAWLEFMTESDYKNLKIDDNGFCNYQCRRYINSSRWDELYSRVKSGGKTGRDIIYRPKSLSGIESNNGWTEGLPPESMGECWVMTKDLGIVFGHTDDLKRNHDRWNENVTHYQPIIKPEDPIY